MKDIEILSEAVIEGERIETENDCLIQINQIIKALDGKDIGDWSGDELSRACVKLDILLINLGQLVSMYVADNNTKYVYRKFRTAGEYKKLRQDINSKVKDSELKAMENVEEEYKSELIAGYLADLLKTKYEDVSRLVMGIQSRLSYIKNEQRNLHMGEVDE